MDRIASLLEMFLHKLLPITVTSLCENQQPLVQPMNRQIAMSDLKQEDPKSQPTADQVPSVHSMHGPLEDSHQVSVISVDSGYELSPKTSRSDIEIESQSSSDTIERRPKFLEIKQTKAASVSSSDCSDTDSPSHRFFTAPTSRKSSSDSSSSIDDPSKPRQRPILRRRTEPNASALQILQEVLDLGEGAEEVLKITLQYHAVDFRDSTDWKMLLAHLVKVDLVSTHESEFLSCELRTNIDKSNNFYCARLPGKGPTAYRRLYIALKEEKTHCGHVHLVEMMTKELGNMCK